MCRPAISSLKRLSRKALTRVRRRRKPDISCSYEPVYVTCIRATHVKEREMMAILRDEFPSSSFTVDLRNDVYFISAPRKLSEVSLSVFSTFLPMRISK
ncbi:hypothetical protein B0T21DRAFT_376477 [Apiosordaria backusii]|uniref:Uncharacterized protein n=1 Tax=Apiosordaria backusii TaxID=314023 RepID=A0AA40A704_9PEZI|nr:hypothetical protein B0T21DRAFT_376477 [Apiosordaria backusii]